MLRHGLIGGYKFAGKQGIIDFLDVAGCIQYDPIDICGKNPELVLQSRVKGFEKDMLYSLLYEDRALIDYFDKWEIYTPQAQRKYGYYTLPVLYGDIFAGRMEAVCDRKSKTMVLKNFWEEKGFRDNKTFKHAFEKSLTRFAQFNGCAYK